MYTMEGSWKFGGRYSEYFRNKNEFAYLIRKINSNRSAFLPDMIIGKKQPPKYMQTINCEYYHE